MPIKGLTDQGASLPFIGVLRKGAPKESEKRPGFDLTYFRFTSDEAGVAQAFAEAYGKEPRDVRIFLPYPTTDQNLVAWREEWLAGGLIHRCDGETTVVIRQKDGSYSTKPQACPNPKGCKPVGRLAVIVPELRRLALVTVLTTSLHDIMELTENLRALEQARGDLRGIPLILKRRQRKVSTPEFHPKGHPQAGQPTGRRVRREKWLLSVEAAPVWVAAQLAVQQAQAMPLLSDGSRPELEAPEDENGVLVDGMTGEILSTVAPGHGPQWDDFEETDAEPPEEQRQEAPNAARTRHLHLLQPDTIRAAIRRKAGWQGDARTDGEPITEKQIPTVAMLLADACRRERCATDEQGVKQARHSILTYLVGVDSTNKLTKREAGALIDWLTDDDSLELNTYVPQECAAILKAAMIEAGQQEMPL